MSSHLLGVTCLRFLHWYFLQMPVIIIRGGLRFLWTVNEIFSFLFLIRTFFKPWKSITDKYPSKGLNIGLIAQAFTLNCTSRIIGMIFRTVAFVIGVAMELVVLAIFVSVLIVWFFFPILIAMDVFYLVGSLS
ncbi:hypothetical protein KJ652_01445 [Patescibacteria group bacterium]|nr:hypothetical protein [Patescibacteria group bacterium]MBU1123233.1 hypothetical protein [Patescibacteria group bacterium]MBU1910961.1 hypothetical protein [Patescibacteria group bacterium]